MFSKKISLILLPKYAKKIHGLGFLPSNFKKEHLLQDGLRKILSYSFPSSDVEIMHLIFCPALDWPFMFFARAA